MKFNRRFWWAGLAGAVLLPLGQLGLNHTQRVIFQAMGAPLPNIACLPIQFFPFFLYAMFAGAVLGNATAGAIFLARRGDFEAAAKVCWGTAYIFALQIGQSQLWTSMKYKMTFVTPSLPSVIVPFICDFTLQWSAATILATFVLRRRAKGTVQVDDNIH